MTTWIKGYERRATPFRGLDYYPAYDTKNGKTIPWSIDDRPVLVLHSTESGDLPTYGGGKSNPHFTLDPWAQKKYQHVPCNVASRALTGLDRATHCKAIQVEIVGWCSLKDAKKAGKDKTRLLDVMTTKQRKWLGQALREIAGECAIPARTTVGFKAYNSGMSPSSYGTSNGVRLTREQFLEHEGLVGHQHVPFNCVTPDTLVLTGDLEWVEAGNLNTGDTLVAFDEEGYEIGSARAGRRFREGVATVHGRMVKDCYRVTMTDGRSVVASGDHKWLVNLPYVNRGSRIQWIETADLVPDKHAMKSLGKPWTVDDSRDAGYLAGCIDCDGSVSIGRYEHTVCFGQSDRYRDVLDKFRAIVAERGLESGEWVRESKGSYAHLPDNAFTDVRVRGGMWATIGLLGSIRPEKFSKVVAARAWVGSTVGKTTQVEQIASVKHIGPREVVSLESSERTYVAAGMLCHNTHGDPGDLDVAELLRLSAPTKPAGRFPEPTRELGLGSKGEDVKWVQDGLRARYRYGKKVTVDGSYGYVTFEAVKEFQRRTSIRVDGNTGPETRATMKKEWGL